MFQINNWTLEDIYILLDLPPCTKLLFLYFYNVLALVPEESLSVGSICVYAGTLSLKAIALCSYIKRSILVSRKRFLHQDF